MSAQTTASVLSPPTRSFTPAPANLLQRKCACGGSANLAGACTECQEKKLTGHTPELIQPKLTISQPNDKYEQEADRVADEVMRMPEPPLQRRVNPEEKEEVIQTRRIGNTITPLIQRQAENQEEEEGEEAIQPKLIQNSMAPLIQRQTDNEEEDEKHVQLKPLNSSGTIQRQEMGEEEDEEETIQAKRSPEGTPTVTPEIHSKIEHIRKREGTPIPPDVRRFMEPRFGYNFSNVRVHSDVRATEVAESLNARAFTLGKDVVLGGGQYSPNTSSGRRLLAHELTHIIQQGVSTRAGQWMGPLLQRKPRSREEHKEENRRRRLLRFLGRVKRRGQKIITTRSQAAKRRAEKAKQILELIESNDETFRKDIKGKNLNIDENVKKNLTELVNQVEEHSSTRLAQDIGAEKTKVSESVEDVKKEKEPQGDPADTEGEKLNEKLDFPEFECSPSPTTLADMAKHPHATNRNFGFTLLKGTRWTFDQNFKDKECSIAGIKEGKFVLDPFIYVKQGTYRYGTFTTSHQDCPNRKLEVFVKITADMADKFKQGEIEHCEDFKRAFALSSARENMAMREIKAEGGFPGAKNERDCIAELEERFYVKLGMSKEENDKVGKCLRRKTRDRDTEGWHDVNVDAAITKEVDTGCTKVTYELDPNHKDMMPELGKHLSKEVVKGCGEKQ